MQRVQNWRCLAIYTTIRVTVVISLPLYFLSWPEIFIRMTILKFGSFSKSHFTPYQEKELEIKKSLCGAPFIFQLVIEWQLIRPNWLISVGLLVGMPAIIPHRVRKSINLQNLQNLQKYGRHSLQKSAKMGISLSTSTSLATSEANEKCTVLRDQ